MSPTRRELLRMLAAGGTSLALPGLAGCGGPPPRLPNGLEPELYLYIWSDYLAPDTIPGFERETGVRVTVDTYESNEELAAKLLAGASGYDLVVPSGYIVPALVEAGALGLLERDRLANLGNVAPLFRGLPYDPAGAHTVPWQWGTSGIAFRRDLVARAPESWDLLDDPAFHQRVTLLDDGREVLGAMLKRRGRSLNSTDPGELAAARDDAIAAKPHLRAFVSAPVKGQLAAGDVWVAQLWNGDAFQARDEQPAIAFASPREGALLWVDFLALATGAPHPAAAHAFVDYILRPEVGAAISAATHYGTPNDAARRILRDAVPFPTDAELARLEFQRDLGPAAALWDRMWTEVRSA